MKPEQTLKELMVRKGGDLTSYAKSLGLAESTIRGALTRSSGIGGMAARTLYRICQDLQIDMVELLATGTIKESEVWGFRLSHKEQDMIERYRELDNFGTEAVDSCLFIERKRNIYYNNKLNFINKPLIFQSAAAGLGDIVNPEGAEFEMVKVPRTKEAEQADYIIKITGDSMEPTYPSGALVLIKSQPAVELGEVGLFYYQGDLYLKEAGAAGLLSYNKEYEPIKIHDPDSFRTWGKALGITEIAK